MLKRTGDQMLDVLGLKVDLLLPSLMSLHVNSSKADGSSRNASIKPIKHLQLWGLFHNILLAHLKKYPVNVRKWGNYR